MDLTTILNASHSANAADRESSLKYLEDAAKSDWIQYLYVLTEYAANPANKFSSRTIAGIHFKNALTSKNEAVFKQICEKWMSIPIESRDHLKKTYLDAITKVEGKTSFISQCIASIATIELLKLEGHSIFNVFLEIMGVEYPFAVKFTVLECLDFICQDAAPYALEPVSQEIYGVIFETISLFQHSEEIYCYAIKAISSAIKFSTKEFDVDDQRNKIMEVICQAATLVDRPDICVCGLQALVKVVSSYYKYLETYMQVLFQITMSAIKSEHEEIILQGIEFWSTLCDEEIDIMETSRINNTPSVCKNYAEASLDYMLPVVFEIIVENRADVDEDDWRPSKAAGVCLMLYATAVGNKVVNPTLTFVDKNLSEESEEKRDAALVAFGCILNGPDQEKLRRVVLNYVPKILELMNDSSTVVRDSSSWVLGRIFEFIPCVATSKNDADILATAMLQGMKMDPNIASNCCWALSVFFRSIYEAYTNTSNTVNILQTGNLKPKTTFLSSNYESFAQAIFETIDRTDVNVSSLRAMAFEALMAYLKYHPKDTYVVVEKVVNHVIQRFNNLVGMKSRIHTSDEINQYSEVLSLTCATLQISYTVLNKDALVEAVNMTIVNLVEILKSQTNSAIDEDVFITFSVIVSSVDEQSLLNYAETMMSAALHGMTLVNEIQVCTAAIGLVGDIARSIGVKFQAFALDVINTSSNIINMGGISYKILSVLFQTIGDISLALETEFLSFTASILPIAVLAYDIPFVELDDYDLIDDLNAVREACLQVYVMTIQGTFINIKKTGGDISVLTNLIPRIISGVERTLTDPNCSEQFISIACGFLGDLSVLYGSELSRITQTSSLVSYLQSNTASLNESIKSSAVWAYGKFKEARLVI